MVVSVRINDLKNSFSRSNNSYIVLLQFCKNIKDFTTLKSTEKGYCKLLGNIKEMRKLKTLSFISLFADAIKRSLRKKVEQVCRCLHWNLTLNENLLFPNCFEIEKNIITNKQTRITERPFYLGCQGAIFSKGRGRLETKANTATQRNK